MDLKLRTAMVTAPQYQVRVPTTRVVLVAPGRSGSTLLQSAILASCDSLTFFEPCLYSRRGDVRSAKCVAQVLRFLECRLPVSGDDMWDPPNLRGWLQHPYKDANSSCAPPPFFSVAQTKLACETARLVLVKEIRLVGQLSQLAGVLTRRQIAWQRAARGMPSTTAVVHLVRDPRLVLASQRRLHWFRFQNTTAKRAKRAAAMEMRRVARRLCQGMVADARAGLQMRHHGGVRYIPVHYEALVSNLHATTARLYGELGVPLPRETMDWLNRTMQGHCSHSVASGNDSASRKEYEYSTCRKADQMAPRRSRWKSKMPTHEQRALLMECRDALGWFGYTSEGGCRWAGCTEHS